MTFYGQTYDLIYLSLVTEHKRYRNKRTHLNNSSLYLSISLKLVKQFRIFIIYTSFSVDSGILVLLKKIFIDTHPIFTLLQLYPFRKKFPDGCFVSRFVKLGAECLEKK